MSPPQKKKVSSPSPLKIDMLGYSEYIQVSSPNHRVFSSSMEQVTYSIFVHF